MNTKLVENTPDSLRQMFAPGVSLIDLRSEIEVASGAISNALCIPILTTSEREQVGTTYATDGAEAAKDLGFRLVSGEVRKSRVDAWSEAIRTNHVAAIFCWRGGMRSAIAQSWLEDQGLEIARIPGGYKELRHFLREEIERICTTRRNIAVWGMTGCAKTSSLAPHAEKIGFIDLEALASHRGSAFGGVYDAQPAQATFENSLAIAAIRMAPELPIVFEAESKLVGRCALPVAVWQSIVNSEMILVEDTLESRAQRIVDDYIVFLLRRFEKSAEQATQDPLTALENFLFDCVQRISKRLGGERTHRITKLLKRALNEQAQTGNPGMHADWIKIILKEYYDPQYTHQLEAKPKSKVIARCRPDQLLSIVESQKKLAHARP